VFIYPASAAKHNKRMWNVKLTRNTFCGTRRISHFCANCYLTLLTTIVSPQQQLQRYNIGYITQAYAHTSSKSSFRHIKHEV